MSARAHMLICALTRKYVKLLGTINKLSDYLRSAAGYAAEIRSPDKFHVFTGAAAHRLSHKCVAHFS